MKARITKDYHLPTGFEVGNIVSIIPNMQADANDVCNAPIGMCYLCKREDGILGYIPTMSLQLLPDDENKVIDWEQRRYEIAKEALSGILADRDQCYYACIHTAYAPGEERTVSKAVSQMAVACADALIEELKRTEQ